MKLRNGLKETSAGFAALAHRADASVGLLQRARQGLSPMAAVICASAASLPST